jgi:hypothetical protein
MALADESELSRNCAEAADLPPTTPRHKNGQNMISWLDNDLGTDELAQALKLLMMMMNSFIHMLDNKTSYSQVLKPQY